eukprot:gene9535-12696_t
MIKERHKQAEKDEEERESARLKAEQERMKREFDEEHKEKQKADFKNAKQQVADAWQKAKEESERLKRAKFAGKRKGKESTEWPPGLEEFFPAPDQFSPGPLQITLPPLPPQPPLPMTPNTAAKVGRLAAEEIGRARREMAAEAEELRKVVVDQTFQVGSLAAEEIGRARREMAAEAEELRKVVVDQTFQVGSLAAEEIGRARREMAAEAEELRKVVVDQTFQVAAHKSHAEQWGAEAAQAKDNVAALKSHAEQWGAEADQAKEDVQRMRSDMVAALKSHAEQWGSEAAQAKEDVQRMRSDMIISSIAFPEAMLRVMSDYPKPAQPSYTSILDYAFPELQAVRQRQPLPSKAPMSHSLALPPTAKANTHDPPSPPKPFRTASASLNTASIDIPAKYLSQSISLPIKASLHQPSAASPTRTSVGGAITLLPTRDSPIALHLLPTMARTGSSPHRGVPHSQSVPLLPTMANSQPGIDVAAKWLAYAEAHPPGTKANANAVGSGARRAGGGAWGASGKSPSQGLGYDMGSLIQGVPNQAVVKYRSTHEAVGLYRDGPARPPTQGLRKVDPLHASLATESVLVYPAGREVPAGSRPRHLMSHSSSYLNESLVQIRSALQGDLSKQAATLNSVPEPSPIILPPGTAQSTMSTNSSYADVARGIKGGARGPIELMNNLQTNAAKLKLLKGMNSGSGQKSTEAMEAFLTNSRTSVPPRPTPSTAKIQPSQYLPALLIARVLFAKHRTVGGSACDPAYDGRIGDGR